MDGFYGCCCVVVKYFMEVMWLLGCYEWLLGCRLLFEIVSVMVWSLDFTSLVGLFLSVLSWKRKVWLCRKVLSLVVMLQIIIYIFLQKHHLFFYLIEKVLCYHHNLGSLRYGNEYCIEFRRCKWKTRFSSSTEAYLNHAVITARRLVHVGLKNEPMQGGGARANGYAATP